MKKLLLFIALCFGFFDCCAQQNSSKMVQATDIHFENQGEQENYHAKQYFLSHYVLQHHERYNADIKINGHGQFVFGSDTILVNNNDSVFNAILARGLIESTLFMDFAFWKSKKIIVNNLEELTFLNQSPTEKKIRFLEWGHMLNPTVYFIELTNKNADSKTSLLDFVKGAELTFIADAWIQI